MLFFLNKTVFSIAKNDFITAKVHIFIAIDNVVYLHLFGD